MKYTYVIGLALAVSAMSSVSKAFADQAPNVIISEVAWAGSAKSTADEWLELGNIGTASADIGGWTISGAGTSGTILTVPTGTLIAPDETFLIANYGLNDPKTALLHPPDLVTTAVSIPNTGLSISLMDTTGTVRDSLADPGTPDAGSSTTFATMERNIADLTWQTATTSFELLDGQLGTPGTIPYTYTAPEIVVDIAGEAAAIPPTSSQTDPALPAEPSSTPTETPPDTTVLATAEPTSIVVTAPSVPLDPSTIDTPTTPAPTPMSEPEVPISESIPQTPEPPESSIADTSIVSVPEQIETLRVTTQTMIETPSSTTPVTSTTSTETAIEETLSPDVPITESASTTQEAQPILPGDILITSALPSPNTGDDEWVELTNNTTYELNLNPLSLVDASGVKTPLSGTIPPNGVVYIPNPKGKLNNDGDTISLINSIGTTIDEQSYGTDDFPAPKKGASVSFLKMETPSEPPSLSPLSYDTSASIVENATTTTNTPSSTIATSQTDKTKTSETSVAATRIKPPATHSSASVAQSTKAASSTTKKTATKTKSAATLQSITLDDIPMLNDETRVSIEGIVIGTPGISGKRSFFIDGAEVYLTKGTLPTLQVGSRVRIKGSISVLSDHRRINVTPDGIELLGTGTPIVHEFHAGLQHGTLARVTGIVSARDGNAVSLRLSDGSSLTVIPGNGVSVTWANTAGSTVSATGILKVSGNTTSLVLRSSEDLIVQNTPSLSATSSPTSPDLVWPGVGVAGTTAGGLALWFWRMRPRMSLPFSLT